MRAARTRADVAFVKDFLVPPMIWSTVTAIFAKRAGVAMGVAGDEVA